jgi:hypothetical protein
VVDDNTFCARTLKDLIERCGPYDVVVFYSSVDVPNVCIEGRRARIMRSKGWTRA